MKSLLIILSVFAFSVTSTFAGGKEMLYCSKVSREEMTKKAVEHQDKILKKLKQTKEQDKQVQTIRQNYGEGIFTQVQKVRGAHTEFLASIEKNATDEELRDRLASLEKEKTNLMSQKLEEMLSIRAILNPEQKQKAISLVKEKANDMCD